MSFGSSRTPCACASSQATISDRVLAFVVTRSYCITQSYTRVIRWPRVFHIHEGLSRGTAPEDSGHR
jgi:hypothetical protein